MPSRSLLVALLTSSLAGCAGTQGHTRAAAGTAATATARASGGGDASGVWDWMYRSTDDQGDVRVEQEEWHLAQRGSRIDGYYDRAVTLMSVDERLFRCNQKLGFTKATRVRVTGVIEGERVQLREVAFDAKPGPCDDGARNLVAYSGVLRGATLLLQWGPQTGQTLVRRADAGHTPLAEAAGLPRGAGGDEAAAAPLTGTWAWELRSIDGDGDERLEREEWHLTETADGIGGWYERVVTRVRGAGAFGCNGQPRYESSTRYTLSGQRFGDKLTLTETDYRASRGPCDNALRRLDSYQGELADADNLVLSWGPGNQVLHRVK